MPMQRSFHAGSPNEALGRSLSRPLSRRGFLVAGGSTLLLAGCGSGQGTGSAPQSGAKFSGKYDGPKVSLDYWNGFTGGDGPTMQAMLKSFNGDHKNIVMKNNTMEWLDFYQRLPAAAKAGPGP